MSDKCENCTSERGFYYDAPLLYVAGDGREHGPLLCYECDWPKGKPVPTFPLCSMCRRRHGPEVKHAGDE